MTKDELILALEPITVKALDTDPAVDLYVVQAATVLAALMGGLTQDARVLFYLALTAGAICTYEDSQKGA